MMGDEMKQSDELERLRAEVADYKRANAALYEQVRALTSGEVLDAALDSLTRAERERDEKGKALTTAEARVKELEGLVEKAQLALSGTSSSAEERVVDALVFLDAAVHPESFDLQANAAELELRRDGVDVDAFLARALEAIRQRRALLNPAALTPKEHE